jgi:hypothetical protein
MCIRDRYNAGLKTHLLGKSSYSDLAHIPVHYCDSSSWVQNSIYNCISWWRPSKSGVNKTETVYFRNFDKADTQRNNWYIDYAHRAELENYLKDTFKYDYYDLYEYENYKERRNIVNIHHFVMLQGIVTKEHESKGWYLD